MGPIGFVLGFFFCYFMFTANFEGALLITLGILAVATWDCTR